MAQISCQMRCRVAGCACESSFVSSQVIESDGGDRLYNDTDHCASCSHELGGHQMIGAELQSDDANG